MNNFYLLSALGAIGCWVLWRRYREGRLLTPASGLHLQFLIFFVLGGFGFIMFPDAEPYLSSQEIHEEVTKVFWPLLLGYCIAVGMERYFFRRRSGKELVLTRAGHFAPEIIFLVAFVGFGGCLLDGRLEVPGLSSLPTYFKNLFFPCFLLAILNCRFYGPRGWGFSMLVVVMALVVGIWSPWRSVLIILAATILMAVTLTKPRWLPISIVVAALVMGLLIPFQNAKKLDYDEFVEDPMAVFEDSMNMNAQERWEGVGVFVAKRINYVRELVYVNKAIDRGMDLRRGETYSLIFYQLIPRFFWFDKPEIQKWAGFTLPREVGLLQSVDETTSWAVNSSAEAAYNFGLKSLIWFIPVMFLVAEGMERLVRRVTSTYQAGLLGNISLFYLYLGHTSVIFASSLGVALFVIIKGLDLLLIHFGVPSRKELSRKVQYTPKKQVVVKTKLTKIWKA